MSAAFRQLGAFDGCLYLLDAAAARLTGARLRLRRYYLIAQPLDIALPAPRGAAGYATRLVTQDEAVSVPFPRPPEVIHARYAQGSVCLAVRRGNELGGFIWLSLGPYEEDEVRCRYVPRPRGSTAWDYDLYLAPEYRGGFAFLKLWADTIGYLRARGVRWSLSRVSAFNPASLAAHRRMGALRVADAYFLQAFGAQLAIATVRPYCHLSWGDRPGPEFVLHAPPLERGGERIRVMR